MERMSTLDAGFFFAEHANVPMHLGALAVFEGRAPSWLLGYRQPGVAPAQ